MTQFKKSLGAWLKKIPPMFTNNWKLKLLALIIALGVWAGLISQDDTLTREKFFTDVPVSVTGADTLRRNSGLIVVSGLEDLPSVRMRADVPQNEYAAAAYSNYNPRIDLTRITQAGPQSVKILTTSTSLYGSVNAVTPDAVEVVVDEYVTNYRVPVSVNVTGNYPPGLGGSVPTPDVSTVAVSGPKTAVDQISRVCVDYDLNNLMGRSGTFRTALPFRFENAEGVPVESSLLEVTSAEVVLRSITVSHTVYPVTSVRLSDYQLTSGTPASGYEVTGVSVSPDFVTVGGGEAALAALEEMFPENTVDVTGRSESFTQQVRIRKTPEISSLSPDTVTVQVSIAPVQVSRVFTGVRVVSSGLPASLKTGSLPKTAEVVVTGPMNEVNKLKSAQITVYADLSSLSGTGTVSLPLTITVNGAAEGLYTFRTVPAEIFVNVTEK